MFAAVSQPGALGPASECAVELVSDLSAAEAGQMPDLTFSWLQLLRSRRIGPVNFHRLLVEHGSASAVLQILPDLARRTGVEGYQICPPAVVMAELAAARRAGAIALLHGMPGYPAALASCADAPPLLWARGALGLLARPQLALVGARNPSALGLRMARVLAADLGQAGYVLVSGLARGIDAAVHHAALPSGTIAVLAGGVDQPYPEENRALMAEIARRGLLLSEQPMGLHPMARHFPQRNRIIAGLARAVVVVEAAARSGSLITAHEALDRGREVMAVPGHPFDARAAGCNQLIRDGAVLIRSAQDLQAALGSVSRPTAPAGRAQPGPVAPTVAAISAAPASSRPRAKQGVHPPKAVSAALRVASQLHQRILDRLSVSPMAEDQLWRDLDLAPETGAAELLSLELEGQIQRQAGGLISRG